jgi:hypothetical protein
MMEEEFEALLDAQKEDKVKELEKFFLDKTKDALDSDFKANALDVAADFDEFRRRARDEEGMPFYAGFFATLSETIKRHHEP